MKNQKLTVLFYLLRNRINKKGKCPIGCRLTFMKKRKQISTGLFINPDYWDSKQQNVVFENNNYINDQLSLIKHKVNQAFLFLQVNEVEFNVEDIYLKYKGENTSKNKTILEVFELHNDRMKKLIDIEYSESTYKKFLEAKNHIRNFIKKNYNRNDYLLKNLKLKFLDDLDFYLKIEKKHKQITINKTIQRVRKIIKLAIAEGFLDRDPFLLYKPKKVRLKIVYLSPEELEALENYTFKQKRLEQVKDLFVFCCYTGLAFQEMSTLNKRYIKTWKDDSLWIEMNRKKTKSKISVPLLPKAIIILEKYDYKLPKISNQKLNSYLKEIAAIVGIDKNLTHHIARKTFATTVLLYNNVPMEVVSKLLGHSKMQITQKHYGEVLKSEVLKAVKRIN